MKPILLIHGYSSEGKNNTPEDIYGSLVSDLRAEFGDEVVLSLNLSRWISLSDGISLDDISFAMDRALRSEFSAFLQSGFNVVIHSTGALVVRNWIKLFSPKPSPIDNLINLAGANFGSGLAHVGRGQLARWGRQLKGTGRGVKVLNELEFGSGKTIDLHCHFLNEGCDMYSDYEVQEFCLIGSETLDPLRLIPIRYVKEDSSDNTVRTSAGNLNLNYVSVQPVDSVLKMSAVQLRKIQEQRRDDEILDLNAYEFDLSYVAEERRQVPFSILYNTAHFGSKIGIVCGSKNRRVLMPLLKRALGTPYDEKSYSKVAEVFEKATLKTFRRVAKLKGTIFDWNRQSQYEGHAQLIFRLRDQYGESVSSFDITLKSTPRRTSKNRLERMIEDRHINKKDKGTITFYLRTQKFDDSNSEWIDLLDNVASLILEISAHEDQSTDVSFVPLGVRLTGSEIRKMLQSFRTTIVDVTLLRIPSNKVFKIKSGDSSRG